MSVLEQVYERHAIERALEYSDLDPMSRAPLTGKTLTPVSAAPFAPSLLLTLGLKTLSIHAHGVSLSNSHELLIYPEL